MLKLGKHSEKTTARDFKVLWPLAMSTVSTTSDETYSVAYIAFYLDKDVYGCVCV